MLSEGKKLPPICVFPEGTVSNSAYMLSFKKGAFESKLPIKIYLIQYENRYFTPAQDIIPTQMGVIFLMSQLLNSVTFYEFEPFYPDHLPF
jgi:1-acyl-sn-glycerol-3-phosphate acyltransferase